MNSQPNAIEIAKAAELCGVGSVSLFRELRRRNILDDKNMPLRHYVENGFFAQEFRQFHLRGTLIKRYYAVTLITPAGMCLISDIARDIRHGRSKAPATLRPGNSEPAGPLGPPESARRCAELLAFVSGNPRKTDICAA